MRSTRNLLLVGAVLAVVGFLLFRPDTLFTNVRAEESLEDAFATTTEAVVATTAPGVAQSTNTTVNTAPEVVTVSSGSFVGIDHRAAGTANVYKSGDRYVLRFEDDTDIQNGPDLYVWVLGADSYEGGTPAEYIDLGTLTGNIGGQNYQLPDSFDPGVHRAVLIWCLRFAVPFAVAPLS